MGKVKVIVTYCGAWGYGSKYNRLKAELENEFGDDVEMVGVATPNVSGYLEVDVKGRLVHSKKNGDGYIDSEAKLQKIIRAVEDAL